MNKQKQADLKLGFQSEKDIHHILETKFGLLKNTSDNKDMGMYYAFDKYNDKCFIEIKTRRINHNQYPTLMFGLNKYEKGCELIKKNPSLRIFYMWKCYDGLYYWEHDESLHEIKFSGRVDRGIDERNNLIHIKQANIHSFNDLIL